VMARRASYGQIYIRVW